MDDRPRMSTAQFGVLVFLLSALVFELMRALFFGGS